MIKNDIFNKDIILFGASKAGEKAYKILNELNIDIKYFVDNDPSKFGKVIFGKKVYGPEKIYEINKKTEIIIISSMYVGEISEQLNKMGFEGHYYDLNGFVFGIVQNNKDNINHINVTYNPIKNESYLITLPRGIALGGLEVWSKNTYELLLENKKKAAFLSMSNNDMTDIIFPSQHTFNMFDVSNNGDNYFDYLNFLIKEIDKIKASVIIPNVSEEVYLACYILKQRFNKDINIVSVVHSDIDFSYIQNSRYESIINKFICVSDEIRIKLLERLPHRERDIFTLITPIRIEKYNRTYSSEERPIQLGYVGRLVKPDKRADLLINLIEGLEKSNVNYNFDIVGVGVYYDIINKYINDNKLEKRVRLLGGISNSLIYEFWRNKDIFINVSDLEGTSISMLEGLYNGAIPVLTSVSGVRQFVKHGENGFVVNTRDISSMIDYIQFLEGNRDLLKKYGQRIHKKVSKICNPDKFIREFINICEIV